MGALRHLEGKRPCRRGPGSGHDDGRGTGRRQVHQGAGSRRAASAQAACLEKGLVIRFLGNSLVLAPPLCATNEELDMISSAVVEAVAEVSPG